MCVGCQSSIIYHVWNEIATLKFISGGNMYPSIHIHICSLHSSSTHIKSFAIQLEPLILLGAKRKKFMENSQYTMWILNFQIGGKLLIFPVLQPWKIHRCLLYISNKVLKLMGGKRTTEYNQVVLLRSILLVICILSEKKAKEQKRNNKMIQLISMHSFEMQTYTNWGGNKNDLLGKQNVFSLLIWGRSITYIHSHFHCMFLS